MRDLDLNDSTARGEHDVSKGCNMISPEVTLPTEHRDGRFGSTIERCGSTQTRSDVRVRPTAIYPSIDTFCRDLIEDAPDAIIYADTGGMIRFWNHGAERIFGFTPSETLGRSLDLIIPENLRQRHWEAYARAMRTGEMRYGAGDVLAVPGKRKDGTRVSIEFCVRPFRNREGRVVGVAAILRDVTKRFEEIKALRSEVAALRERLEGRA